MNRRSNVPSVAVNAWRRIAPAVLAAGILTTLPSCESSRPLRPFTTDGCSSFPDGTPAKPDAWHSACVVHDIAYWQGGTYGERRAADQKLRDDVAARGYRRTAKWMYCGVRLGGSPWWPTTSRWGYGWPWGRGYRPLRDAEKAQAAALLPAVKPQTHLKSLLKNCAGTQASRLCRVVVVPTASGNAVETTAGRHSQDGCVPVLQQALKR